MPAGARDDVIGPAEAVAVGVDVGQHLRAAVAQRLPVLVRGRQEVQVFRRVDGRPRRGAEIARHHQPVAGTLRTRQQKFRPFGTFRALCDAAANQVELRIVVELPAVEEHMHGQAFGN